MNLCNLWILLDVKRSSEEFVALFFEHASIDAKLRPSEHPSYKSQVLMIFLVEMDERSAKELQEMSVKKRPTTYSMLGISSGKLFCLVVGRSFEQGVASVETTASLQRFVPAITEILSRY